MRKRYRVRYETAAVLILLMLAATVVVGQSVYWKKDYIRDDSGQIVAEATPEPSDTTVPSTPTSLGHSGLTATAVTLSWTGSSDSGGSGLAGYKIYRGLVVVGTVNSSSTGFTDSALQPSTAYSYKVVAFDAAGNHSTASNTDSFTTPAS